VLLLTDPDRIWNLAIFPMRLIYSSKGRLLSLRHKAITSVVLQEVDLSFSKRDLICRAGGSLALGILIGNSDTPDRTPVLRTPQGDSEGQVLVKLPLLPLSMTWFVWTFRGGLLKTSQAALGCLFK
jgi:hypothetical protein